MEESSGALAPVFALLSDGAAAGLWRKCVLTAARGDQRRDWRKLVAQPVRLSTGPAVKVVTTAASGRETTRSLPIADWPAVLETALSGGPCHLDVLAADHD